MQGSSKFPSRHKLNHFKKKHKLGRIDYNFPILKHLFFLTLVHVARMIRDVKWINTSDFGLILAGRESNGPNKKV